MGGETVGKRSQDDFVISGVEESSILGHGVWTAMTMIVYIQIREEGRRDVVVSFKGELFH